MLEILFPGGRKLAESGPYFLLDKYWTRGEQQKQISGIIL